MKNLKLKKMEDRENGKLENLASLGHARKKYRRRTSQEISKNSFFSLYFIRIVGSPTIKLQVRWVFRIYVKKY